MNVVVKAFIWISFVISFITGLFCPDMLIYSLKFIIEIGLLLNLISLAVNRRLLLEWYPRIRR